MHQGPTPKARARWLIVGLGNPGEQYATARHNLGARIVEALRAERRWPAFRTQRALRVRVSRGDQILAIPTTFMNESGTAVAALVRHVRVPLERLLVVHDDKDLAFGELKLQRGRSSAGHRGIQSVIDELGTSDFWRLRIGIGAPPHDTETEVYVLEPFTPEEQAPLTADVFPHALRTIEERVGASRA